MVGVALRHAAARAPDLFGPGARLVVGFSGGQDSACLLHALLSHRHGVEVVAAHVDHGLRPDSAADAERACALAAALGAPVVVRRVDVAAYRAGRRRCSVQQAARAARYQALASVVAEVGAAALVLAHTADDQAETVLLRLLRGAGLDGMAAMRLDETLDPSRLGPAVAELPTWPTAAPTLRVARPLLYVERATTLAYCQEQALPYVDDPSNLSRAYMRNRVRHDLLPRLQEFNPAVRLVLARAADLAAEDVAALDAVVGAVFSEVAQPHGPGALLFARGAWLAQPRALQRRLLRRAIETLSGGLQDVPATPIEDALDLVAAGQPDRRYHLPRGTELRTLVDGFVVARRGGAGFAGMRNTRDQPPAGV